MRAAAVQAYGPVETIEVMELPSPEPGPGEVRLHAVGSSVNPLDWKLVTGALRRVHRQTFPFIPGFDVAGEVTAVGAGVTDLALGDVVMGLVSGEHGGAWAQEVVTRAEVLGPVPRGLNLVHAATLPLAGQAALQGLRDRGGLERGQRVLIIGASGGVGVHAVQIARILGAEITATCRQEHRDLVLGLGAHRHLDHHTEDFRAGDTRYHLVFDIAGVTRLSECRGVLEPDGTYVTTLPSLGLAVDAAASVFGKRSANLLKVVPRREDVAWLARHVDMGSLRPVVSHVYSLEEAVEACVAGQHRHHHGKIALTIDHGWDDPTAPHKVIE